MTGLFTGRRIRFTREELTCLADFAHVNERAEYVVERDTDGVLWVMGAPTPRAARPLYRLSPLRNPEKVTT